MAAKPEAANSVSAKDRLGEALVKHNLINPQQLEKALKRRSQVDLPLGSILIEMGFISTDELLDFLSKKFAVPAVNLFKIDIDQHVLDLVPQEKMKQFKILPIEMENNRLTLAMVSPHDFMTISDLEFTIGKKIKPVIVPYFMMESALGLLSSSYEDGLKGEAIAQAALEESSVTQHAPKIDVLLKYMVKSGASDMILTAGVPPSIKASNEVKRLATVSLTPEDTESYARSLLSKADWEKFKVTKELDISITFPEIARFRINFYRQRGSVAITIRHVMDRLPSLKELGLPEWIRDYALRHQGLILISGPAGHGKSTTLCSMVDIINTHRRCNILTLEDPIEYLHKHRKSNVNQREIGRDTESFETGLRSIFRQAPDVIVIGELRDKESFEIALRAARTGHLVLSTMNAANSTAVIRIVINMFPPHQQDLIRMLLSESLLLSMAQRLIPRRDHSGMVLAAERFINSNRISNLIREDKTHQIRSMMETGAEEFSPLELSLANLYKSGKIEFEDGLMHATSQQLYRDLTGVSV